MNLDNLARSANAYIKNIASTFGTESTEYHDAAKQIKLAGVETREDKFGVMQIKRGKALQQDSGTNLQELRRQQQRAGTANQQAQKYKKEITGRGDQFSKSNIKKAATRRWEMHLEANSYYQDNYAEIHSNAELLKAWTEAGKNAKWKGGTNTFFERALDMTEALKNRDYERFENIEAKNEKALLKIEDRELYNELYPKKSKNRKEQKQNVNRAKARMKELKKEDKELYKKLNPKKRR